MGSRTAQSKVQLGNEVICCVWRPPQDAAARFARSATGRFRQPIQSGRTLHIYKCGSPVDAQLWVERGDRTVGSPYSGDSNPAAEPEASCRCRTLILTSTATPQHSLRRFDPSLVSPGIGPDNPSANALSLIVAVERCIGLAIECSECPSCQRRASFTSSSGDHFVLNGFRGMALRGKAAQPDRRSAFACLGPKTERPGGSVKRAAFPGATVSVCRWRQPRGRST